MATDNFLEDTQALDLEGYRLSFLAPTRGSMLPAVFDLDRYFPGRLYWKWALMEKYTVDEAKLEELCAAGWEMLDHTTRARDLLRLTSRLGLVLALTLPGVTPERGELELWVRSQDLLHAKQYPVILVYEAEQNTSVSELARLVPGTHAIVFEGEAVYRYEVSQLGDTGIKLLQAMMVGTHYASDRVLPSEYLYSVGSPKKSVQNKLKALHENMLMQFAMAQLAATRLSELYWSLHLQSVGKPARLAHSLLDIPPAFRHANLYENHGNLIPATDALEAAIRAISDAQDGAKGWGADRSKSPTYIHSRATSTTAVTLRMNQQLIPEHDRAVAQQLWERVTTYSDNDGDVLLAMLAQVVAAGPDEQGGTWITAQAILDYRGILPKRHEVGPGVYRDAGHRPDDMQEISDCVGRLRDMHISVRSWREPRKPGGRRRKVVQESYLVLISDFLTQTEEGQVAKEDALQIAWYYRPGSCLDVPVRKNAKVAWLLQQALRYDPYHEKWEKRLARYFMFQLRLNNAFGGTTIKRSIREILEESGLFSSINRTDPIRTKERFENAMRTLAEHGHISDWGETPYLEAMKRRPARGWLEMWLAQELVITAAPLIEDLARDMLDQIHAQHPQQRITAPKKQRRKKGGQQGE